ncbi:MAG: serine/threonine-protein kinase [Polyangiaceae bacterium]
MEPHRASDAAEDELEGRLVDGRYRVGRCIASGGFAKVYAAEHIGLRKRVALKVLRKRRDDPARRSERVSRFLDEARVLDRLRHPHIVSALAAGFVDDRDDESPYVALVWAGDETLADLFAASRGADPRPPAEAWSLLRPVVEAVAHAHEQGVVHGDLTPSNVMLEVDGDARVPRVIDFGVARIGEDTEGPRVAFTRDYAAPEQVSGRPPTPETDVHALGLLFLEALTHRPAYGQGDAGLAAIDPMRPSAAALGAEAGPFEEPLERALALDPRDRYPDAGALAHAMQRAAEELDASRPRPVNPAPSAPPPLRSARPAPTLGRRRLVAALAAGALLAATGGVVAWRWPSSLPITSLDLATIVARLRQRGFAANQVTSDPTFKFIMVHAGESPTVRPNEIWATVRMQTLVACDELDTDICTTRIRDALVRLPQSDRARSETVAFASDWHTTLWVAGDDPAIVTRVRDVAIEGLHPEIVGILPRDARPSDADDIGETLASLGPGALTNHLRHAGFEVFWASEGKDGVATLAGYRLQDAVGNATLYRGHVSEVLASLEAQPEPFAWAQAGDYLLVLRGPGATATAASLALVLEGTDAHVGGARP